MTTSAVSELFDFHSSDAALAFSGSIVNFISVGGMSMYAFIVLGTLKLVTGTGTTCTSTVAETLPHLAVITVFPGAMPVTRPLITSAMDGSSEVHSRIAVSAAFSGMVAYIICAGYNLRGGLDMKEKHFADAVTAYGMAKTVAEKSGGDYVKLKSLRGLSDAYGKSGNYAAALDWLNEYVSLSDRLAKDRSRLAVEDFKVQYHTAEKENELEIRKIESQNRLLLVVLLSLLALILLICMGVVLRMLYMKKRQEEILRRNDEAKSRLLSLVPAMKDRKKAEFISEVAEEIEGLDSDKEAGVPKLTNREMEIVRMCCEGLSSKEIAAQMELSVRTVDTHKANIFRKLKIKSTVELVKYVAETGLLG